MNVTLEQLLEAGSHFGHQVRRWNPKMAPFIYAVNDGVHVFDLTKTRENLLNAGEYLKEAAKDGKIILFVGTKRQSKELVEESAKKVGMPYLTSRWLGGTLTNFEQIKRSLRKLGDMKKARSAGDYDRHTKRERLLIDRDITSLERVFGGVADLKKLPDIVFIVDTHEEKTAVLESRRVGLPIVGIVDTNSDPTLIDYPIPANDDAIKSLTLVITAITEAIAEGLGTVLPQGEIVDKVEKPKKKTKKVKDKPTN